MYSFMFLKFCSDIQEPWSMLLSTTYNSYFMGEGNIANYGSSLEQFSPNVSLSHYDAAACISANVPERNHCCTYQSVDFTSNFAPGNSIDRS